MFLIHKPLRIMKILSKNKYSGNLKISYDVVEEITAQTVNEIEGVFSLASLPLTFKELLFEPSSDKPIKISFIRNMLCIDVAVNLHFGYRIKKITESIQKHVKTEVQNMSGITVSKVNVFVKGIK